MSDYTSEELEQAVLRCENEPIHLLGQIQAHGVLLVLDATPERTILQASANLSDFLDVLPGEVCGKKLESLGHVIDAGQVEIGIQDAQKGKVVTGAVFVVHHQTRQTMQFRLATYGGFYTLELIREDKKTGQERPFSDLLLHMQKALLIAQGEANLSQYFHQIAEIIREVIEFDRVLIYCFDTNWDGEVIAESRVESMQSYLGNRFPAADIPPQARELYIKNIIRMVADVDAQPTGLVPGVNPLTLQPLDMTNVSIRSLSPVHVKYLSNMGVRASLSISLLQNGRLWGLIACHHMTAKVVSLDVQDAAMLLSQIVSSRVSATELQERHNIGIEVSNIIGTLLKYVSYETESEIMSRYLNDLMVLMSASGVVVIIEGQHYELGITPDPEIREALIEWLRAQPEADCFSSDFLAQHFSHSDLLAAKVSGLCAAPVSKSMRNCILWYRPEKVKSFHWAGNPKKSFYTDEAGDLHLSPRSSFEAWTELWKGHSDSWSRSEIEAGITVANALTEGLAQKSKIRAADDQLRIAAIAFEAQEGIVVTDARGIIQRVNTAFSDITGYSFDEVIGKTPSILSSGRQDVNFYRAMWDCIHKTGAWCGEIWNRRKNGEVYPEYLTVSAVRDKNSNVTHYVGTFSDITHRKSFEDEINHLAFYDPLTELPNRRLLVDRLQQILASSPRSRHKGALLFIDLDNFKTLNDTQGHEVGDILLKQVALRLSSCMRECDTVSRLGGDEFVVVLADLNNESGEAAAQTEKIGEKIIASLSKPFVLSGNDYHCSASIGATLFGEPQTSVDEVLGQADIAMYQAKKSGRNNLRFFDQKMQDAINARVSLEEKLRKAIEEKEFRLFFQVQVDASGRPFGAEALIRWEDPNLGLRGPQDFIHLAEETGLIIPIGHWVLLTACAQIHAWQQHEKFKELVLAVNISAIQFRQNEFVSQLKEIIHRYSINPMLLKLELTESMLLENIRDDIETMNELKKIGVQISLDDFGTGYSSLQYLKILPLDQLKIDQSFVREIVSDGNDRAIVRTVIAMAQSLNLDVIAEGVETESQFQLLLGKGCSNFQGYLFGKPVPLKEFELLIGKLHEKAQDFSSVSVTDTDLLAENGLRQRYHHLIAVIDNLPSMIGYWDKNMRNRFGNMAYSSWFGITPAQMLGKHIREVIGEERFQLNLPYIEGVLRGERQEFERDIPAPDGKQIRQSFAQYIPDIVNGEVRGFFIQVSDIGSVKHAEAEIKRSEAKFRKLFDSTADAVILFDENGFFDCNRATLEMFRCASKSEFYSKQPEDLSPQYQTNGRASKEFAQEQVALALRDGTVRFEWLNKRLDSEDTFPSEILLSAMDLDDRQMLQCVIRDIGERRKNEEAFIVAKNEAEVANRAKSAFLSVVSHELRTPLNGILGMTELLQSSELDEDQREYADTVIDCGNNLLLIINEILDYSNIEKGMLGLSAKSCDMGVLIDECFAMEAHLAKSKGLEMTTSWSGSALEKYFLDVDHLKQMLLNLIDNAIKFTAHGFVKIEARIVEKQAKLHVLEFSVTDSGIGISEDKQKMLFRPFTQLDSSSTRSYGGTGIGLSIVSKLSGLMGGECGVESELQKGSRFWFRIKAEIFDGQIIENNECRKR